MTNGATFLLGLRDAMLRGWFNSQTREMFTGFDIPDGASVLDAGCGDGRMAGFCAAFAERLILIDVDQASVAAAIAHTRASGPAHVTGAVSDCAPLPLASLSIDRVVCTEVLEHVDDPALVMAELERVARPGGLLLLTVPDPISESVQRRVAPGSMWRKPHHLRVFGRDEFASLVTDAGLTIERRSSYGFYQAIWWAMFWACDVPLDAPDHPALLAWERAWGALLETKDGALAKHALDDLMPKSQLIVARKPLP